MREIFAPSRPYRQAGAKRGPSEKLIGSSRNQCGQRFLDSSVPRLKRQTAAGKDQKLSRGTGGGAPDSLDTVKQQATTVQEWMESQENHYDRYAQRYSLWRKLCATVYGIWQNYAAQLRVLPHDGAEWKWWAAYDEEKAKIKAGKCVEFEVWLDSYAKKRARREFPGWSEGFADVRFDWRTGSVGTNEELVQWLYLDEWKRRNRPMGICAKALCWEKQYFQLLHCQAEWIGYRASCCGDRTEPVAVPIGCNHRLCPLCNWHRSENAQRKGRQLFDRFEHPQFITLTVPNVKRITKRTFEHFRKRVRQFLALHKEIFLGGVYAIETTYNRDEKSWHIHAHVLADGARALPKKGELTGILAGRMMYAFTRFKTELEFDWTRLWAKNLGNFPRENASCAALENDRGNFEFWVRACEQNRTREFRNGQWQDIGSLSAAELERRRKWNRENRRILDIRPVTDRVKALKEVLKYITKSSDFIDLPECVIAFYEGTRGARLIQTWGSCYGIDLAVEFDTTHPEDHSKLECSCGCNHWERFGVLGRRDVCMDASGQWRPRPELTRNLRGTVPRPTIRALDAPEERNGDQPYGE
jgi:hypothetical protein